MAFSLGLIITSNSFAGLLNDSGILRKPDLVRQILAGNRANINDVVLGHSPLGLARTLGPVAADSVVALEAAGAVDIHPAPVVIPPVIVPQVVLMDQEGQDLPIPEWFTALINTIPLT